MKTDTKGFDFDILRQSLDFIHGSKPVIFFEYDPGLRPAGSKAGLDTIGALIDAGYSDFIYYDNYGNFLIHANAQQLNILTDLHNYLASPTWLLVPRFTTLTFVRFTSRMRTLRSSEAVFTCLRPFEVDG